MGELVSVIMPMYNAARFLEEAINSVTSQTYENLELLIVDDGSTDDSLEIAKRCAQKDPRIRILQNEKNCGVAETRNHGIAEAKGQYIALLDSDDVWVETKLERQLRLLEEKQAQIAYCSYDFIDEQGRSVYKPFLVPEETSWEKMLVSSVISCSTILVTAVALTGHRFNKSYYHEDYVLWMELLASGIKAAGDSNVLAHYRQVAGSRADNKMNSAKQRWIVFREVLHLGLWKSLVSFVRYACNGLIKYSK